MREGWTRSAYLYHSIIVDSWLSLPRRSAVGNLRRTLTLGVYGDVMFGRGDGIRPIREGIGVIVAEGLWLCVVDAGVGHRSPSSLHLHLHFSHLGKMCFEEIFDLFRVM